jgi:hypothetical protein
LDVTYGNNSDPGDNDGVVGYSAGVQYDNCSGWGTINWSSAASTGYILLLPTKTGKLPDAPTNINAKAHERNVTISWSAAPGALGYFLIFPLNGVQGYYLTKATSIELTNLSPKESYLISVNAVNNSGNTPSVQFFLPPVQ